MNTDKGLITITLAGHDLDLRFRARALQIITKITGQSPPAFMSRLEGVSMDDGSAISAMADVDFVVTLLAAGLSNHPKFGRLKLTVLNERLLTLLEEESEKSDIPLWILPGKVLGEILPAVLSGMGLKADDKPAKDGDEEGEDGDQKKDVAPAAAGSHLNGIGES